MKVSLFGSEFAKDLLCAIQAGARVPEFLKEANWRFLGTRESEAIAALIPARIKTLDKAGHVIFPRVRG